jgi:hypothetical protein
LSVAAAEVETKAARNQSAGRGHKVVETCRASMLDETDKAVLVKRTVKGEKYGTIDV